MEVGVPVLGMDAVGCVFPGQAVEIVGHVGGDVVVVLGEHGDDLVGLRPENGHPEVHGIDVFQGLVHELIVTDIHELGDVVDGEQDGVTAAVHGDQLASGRAEIPVD